MYQKSQNHGGYAVLARAILVLLVVCVFLASLTSSAVSESEQKAQPDPVDTGTGSDTEQILINAAQSLGWPTTISTRPDLPGQALQVSADGKGQDSPMWLSISTMAGLDQPTLLDALESRGLTRGVFHGRQAIILRAGDLVYNGNTLTRAACGLIAWRCGPYVFAAEDATGSGRESEIAEALHAAAESGNLCGIADTVVILAETTDAPGVSSLGRLQTLAQAANRYYSLNAYGRAGFHFTFMDADGSQGDHDWYNVGPSLATYCDDGYGFVCAAVERAFEGVGLPEVAYLERVIVVYPAHKPASCTGSLCTATFTPGSEYYVELPGAERNSRVYITNLILVSEEDELGNWVHELGHTLYSKYASAYGQHRIPDLYLYDELEQRFVQSTGHWDLMGTGCQWGNPVGSAPTHMSSYTKEAANWLRYTPAQMDRDYVLTALENQVMGDSVLKLDDPASEDPLCYYIIEARDRDVDFGAPESGVVIYHVTYDHKASRAAVNAVAPQTGAAEATRAGQTFQRSTLHEAASHQGVKEYLDPVSGFRVRLLTESFRPYKATVRVERYQAN